MNTVEMKILVGLHRNVTSLDRKTSALAAEYGLTFSQFMVLEALYSKGNMSVGDVRDSILSSVGTISLIVNNLVKLDYVVRLCDEKDRRVSILSLTEKGHELISQIVPQNINMVHDELSILSKEEKEDLLYLLKKVGGVV